MEREFSSKYQILRGVVQVYTTEWEYLLLSLLPILLSSRWSEMTIPLAAVCDIVRLSLVPMVEWASETLQVVRAHIDAALKGESGGMVDTGVNVLVN